MNTTEHLIKNGMYEILIKIIYIYCGNIEKKPIIDKYEGLLHNNKKMIINYGIHIHKYYETVQNKLLYENYFCIFCNQNIDNYYFYRHIESKKHNKNKILNNKYINNDFIYNLQYNELLILENRNVSHKTVIENNKNISEYI